MPDPRLLDFAYPKLRNLISLYQEESWYWISGITFREFMLGVERPTRLLLLSHDCSFADTETYHTRLDYIDENDLGALVADEVYGYGDFCWLDFCSLDVFAQFQGQEFLELLYLKQLGKPLTSPHFPTLQNHFAYLGHDDGWALQLWVDSSERLGRILAQVLTLKYAAFSGRRSIPEPDEAIANALVARAKEGLLIDFRDVDAHTTTIPIYRIGAVTDMDAARQIGDEQIRNNTSEDRLHVAEKVWRHELGP